MRIKIKRLWSVHIYYLGHDCEFTHRKVRGKLKEDYIDSICSTTDLDEKGQSAVTYPPP